ncbi:hypothetical protein [Streptomyces sp. NPDC014746]|uniref:hypothetical protein n=1 Tax=Streptomyces sp. NPDC014746 TaxID=3364904 RepID=UPI0036FE2E68
MSRLRAAETVQVRESDFGLRDFDDRSFSRRHHHTALVTAACAHSRVSLADRSTALFS